MSNETSVSPLPPPAELVFSALPIEYGRGATTTPEAILRALGWVALLAGLQRMHDLIALVNLYWPIWEHPATSTFEIAWPQLITAASGLLLLVGGIGLVRGHRWPMTPIAIGEAVMLASSALYIVPNVFRTFTAYQFNPYRLLNYLTVLQAAVFPAFAVVYFFRSPTNLLGMRSRALRATAVAGLLAGLARIGEGHISKMFFGLLVTRLDGGPWLGKADTLETAGIALAYIAVGVFTASASIRILLHRRGAFQLLFWNELIVMLLIGYGFVNYVLMMRNYPFFDPQIVWHTLASWFGSLYNVLFSVLVVWLRPAIGDESLEKQSHVAC